MDTVTQSRPLYPLTGFCEINGKSCEVTQPSLNVLRFGTYYQINLHQCAHVELNRPQIVLYTLNQMTSSKTSQYLLIPTDWDLWSTWLAPWISFVRQIPLWQIELNDTISRPMARGQKKNALGEWDPPVLFRFIHQLEEIQYLSSEDKDQQPLGRLKVGRDLPLLCGHGVVRVETWFIRFETQALARKWSACVRVKWVKLSKLEAMKLIGENKKR